MLMIQNVFTLMFSLNGAVTLSTAGTDFLVH